MHAAISAPFGARWTRRRKRSLQRAILSPMSGGRPGGRGSPRGRGRGFEPPGFGGFGPPWGFGGPWGHRVHFRRAGKARRGDVRLAALLLLAEEPRNGYGIMQEIEQRSDGVWRPSPGSVYPALSQLEDEGLIRSEDSPAGTGKLFALTDAGRTYVDGLPSDQPVPWETAAEGVSDATYEVFGLMKQVGLASVQVVQAGTPEQLDQAREVLTEARRRLYRILAGPDEPGPDVESA